MHYNTAHLRKFVAPEYVYGIGSRKLIAKYARNYYLKKILLVTDQGVIDAQWSNEIQNLLKTEGFETIIFSNVSPNPRDYQIMEGAQVFKENGCDSIVAVGGGSVMDCAKGIGIVVSNNKHILDFVGVDKIDIPAPPLLCIPTTSGTAADISQFCIITDTKQLVKVAIVSKMTIPDLALIDPQTTLSMPMHLTIETGLDALTHAIEAFVSNASSPMTDINALESIRLVHTYLPKVYEDPNDMQYREQMSLASLYAGLAFSNASLGAVHAMAHSLGGFKDLPHGLCNSILLDKVVHHNFDFASDKYRKIASVLKLNASQAGDMFVKKDLQTYLIDFKENVNINKKLSAFGLKHEDIEQLSQKASQDACLVTNPKKLELAEIKEIYEQSI